MKSDSRVEKLMNESFSDIIVNILQDIWNAGGAARCYDWIDVSYNEAVDRILAVSYRSKSGLDYMSIKVFRFVWPSITPWSELASVDVPLRDFVKLVNDVSSGKGVEVGQVG